MPAKITGWTIKEYPNSWTGQAEGTLDTTAPSRYHRPYGGRRARETWLDAMTNSQMDDSTHFGPFRLCPRRRELFYGTHPVSIGHRAMDILITLADNAGKPLGKEQLIAAAWPNVFVHESNLKVTIASLRRTLRTHFPSSDFIKTIVGRGYWLAIDKVSGGTTSRLDGPVPKETAPPLFETMGVRRTETCQTLGRRDDWSNLIVERRTNGAGSHPPQAYPCNELIFMLAGRSMVQRTGEGRVEQCLATPGTAWTGPVGFYERAEIESPITCLHMCLPPTLIAHSALADYDIDPDKVELSFAGGFVDPTIIHLAHAFSRLLAEPAKPTDRLFADGLTAALTAHLIASYTIDRWKPPARKPALDARRLRRVIEYIDEHYAEPITLDRLATEAGLSPFHFSRLFRDATGFTPHRYVTDRRIQAARKALERETPLRGIALESGFGSQDNFTRVFRKTMGLTPGQYRDLCRR